MSKSFFLKSEARFRFLMKNCVSVVIFQIELLLNRNKNCIFLKKSFFLQRYALGWFLRLENYVKMISVRWRFRIKKKNFFLKKNPRQKKPTSHKPSEPLLGHLGAVAITRPTDVFCEN